MRDDVLGMRVRIASGLEFDVVGVTASGFVEPEFHGAGHRTALWLPWRFNPSPAQWGWAATTDTLTFAGRLAPSVRASQAAERLSALVGARWRAELGTASNVSWATRIDVTAAIRVV